LQPKQRFWDFRSVWKTLVTFHLVTFAWIFFRAKDLPQAVWIVRHLFEGPPWKTPVDFASTLPPFTSSDLILCGLLICVLELVQWAQSNGRWAITFDRQPSWIRWPAYYAIIVAIFWIGNLGGKSFIYFQF
jgi:hypothetical protein